jgi:putative acetyltransferase
LFEIRQDDVSGVAVRVLLAVHLAGMHENSPPENVFALDLSGLQAPGVTVWSAWDGEALAAIGALKILPDGTGEVKSMRTAAGFLRRGAAAALLAHIIASARNAGLTRLSLETGRGPAFEPALAMYRKFGFVEGAAFSDYTPNAFSQFFHLALE